MLVDGKASPGGQLFAVLPHLRSPSLPSSPFWRRALCLGEQEHPWFFYGQGEGDRDTPPRQCLSLLACLPCLAFGFFCRSCPNPIFFVLLVSQVGERSWQQSHRGLRRTRGGNFWSRSHRSSRPWVPGLPEVLPGGKGSVALPAGGLGGHQPGPWQHRVVGPHHIVCPIASSSPG